jgi:diadenosine tetraphosphate (Ap4A) HIT family hydrolase
MRIACPTDHDGLTFFFFAWIFGLCSRVQVVEHVHFHIIPKPSDSDKEGLVVGWPQTEPSKDELAAIHAELQAKL